MNALVKSILPTIATALGGPLAGAAVTFLADKLGISEPTQEKIQQTLSGMSAADLVKMKELDYEFQKYMAEIGIKLDLAQIKVNEKEAESTNWWVSGWRPYIGWICGTGLGYQFLVRPLLNGLAHLFGVDGDVFNSLEIQDLFAIVTTMLGNAALRSMDKKHGVAS
jgi:Protein of unknown function (DUF3154).